MAAFKIIGFYPWLLGEGFYKRISMLVLDPSGKLKNNNLGAWEFIMQQLPNYLTIFGGFESGDSLQILSLSEYIVYYIIILNNKLEALFVCCIRHNIDGFLMYF